MADFYDPITERWYDMKTPPLIERYKPPTVAAQLAAKANQSIRIAEHAHVWQAIEATATATQMSTACPEDQN